MEIRRYAICGAILCSIVGGAYYLGYKAGANNTRIEYVEKQVEVIKYVEKKKADIYSRRSATRPELLELMYNGKL